MGHDSNKKMLMNFGPINRKGGEKRLNVIFSRAKKHMAIVTSIRHTHITNDHNEGADYFKKFLHYAEMVSTGNMRMARLILDGLVLKEQKVKASIDLLAVTTTQVKKALENKGYIVDEYIGQSNFKCTLGVKRSSGEPSYSMGILIDDDRHYQNDDLVEQYFQRPTILQAFGWQIVPVFAKDWVEDSDRILQKLIDQLNGITNVNPTEQQVEPVGVPDNRNETDLQFEKFESADKQKFWEIAQNEDQLHIRFGRIGTMGQTQIKTFPSLHELEFHWNELIDEQKRAGYVATKK